MDWMLRQLADLRKGKPWVRRKTEPGQLLPIPRLPCQIVLTGKDHYSKEPKLIVRCVCMAEVRGQCSSRYYNYDPIGIALSLEEAKAMWQAHVRDREQEL
jgi:hypothetical protein